MFNLNTHFKSGMLITLLSITAIISCGTPENKNSKNNTEESTKNEIDSLKPIIEANIIENALGLDVKPVFDSISIIKAYSVEQITNFWLEKELQGIGNIDSLIAKFINVDDLSKSKGYPFYKWQQTRFTFLKEQSPNTELYEIIKAQYTIDNPLTKTKVKVLNYYLVSDNKIIAKISENDFKDAYQESPNIPHEFIYEYALFKNDKSYLP
jgi:hypothetical protein